MNSSQLLVLGGLLILLSIISLESRADERKEQQEKLDNNCQQAREVKIAPLREAVIKDCISEGKEEKYCQGFYKDYGERTGHRAALFMDLPECEKAFEHSRSDRNSS
ncbi:MAG: hypothetical protein L3J22_00645 [Xanthomonadales bacterium]|nr:hypothetical protein [Xanthomonadales bacterium]